MIFKQRDGHVVDPEGDFNETVQSFDDHISLYANPELVPETEFLTSNPRRVPLAQIPSLPDANPGVLRDELIARLHGDGVDLYAVDTTSPDVAEAGGHVVKVFSPQLQPLDSGYRRRFLGGRRMWDKPVALGLVPAEEAGRVNPLPHPFP
ncbi:YcaO-like family protein [Saccharomonospora sp. NPDC046836]|uniref:YcaO-like family protein n=1 Tax=Saccharomonospora sp. NPDC046836 TaxID=3156921 RepID=UPI0033CB5D03